MGPFAIILFILALIAIDVWVLRRLWDIWVVRRRERVKVEEDRRE